MMILKVKFEELAAGQRFYVAEKAVNDRSEEFMKIEATALHSAPRGRTECRDCGTPLAKWVNATRLVAASNRHFCPDDDVYIVHDKGYVKKKAVSGKPDTQNKRFDHIVSLSAKLLLSFEDKHLAEVLQASGHVALLKQQPAVLKQMVASKFKSGQYEPIATAFATMQIESAKQLKLFVALAQCLLNERPEWGRPLYRVAFQHSQRIYGDEHPTTAEIAAVVSQFPDLPKQTNSPYLTQQRKKVTQLTNQMNHFLDNNQLQAAYDSASKAIAICDLSLGPLSEYTLITLSNLSTILRMANKHDRAIPRLEKIFLARFFQHGIDSQECQQALHDLVVMIDATAQKTNQSNFYDRYGHYIKQYQQLTSG